MKACVVAESVEAARELCAGARGRADAVVLIQIGGSAASGVADKVCHIEVPADNIVDDAYVTVNQVLDAEGPDFVLVQSSRRMSQLAGRAAAHLGTAVISNVVEFDGDLAVTRYYSGAALRKNKPTGTGVYTVGTGVFDGAAASGSDEVESVAFVAPARPIVRTAERELPTSDVNLQAADVIVCVGRGFAAEDDLNMARELVAKVGGELGCSRPIAESNGWLPREAYLGVTGVVAAPKVYLGIGVSGQMQHMVGIDRSGTIIAINKDKNAPIFKQVDYGIVGDLNTVLPALTAAL